MATKKQLLSQLINYDVMDQLVAIELRSLRNELRNKQAWKRAFSLDEEENEALRKELLASVVKVHNFFSATKLK